MDNKKMMNVNIWDLFGKTVFSRWQDSGKDNAECIFSISLSDVIIYPRDTNSNRRPYLQDFKCPVIEDLIDNDNFNNVHTLEDILSRFDIHLLEDWFKCQKSFIHREMQKAIGDNLEADCDIILVPDTFSYEKQMKLLKICRNIQLKPFLLWYSVAIALGSEERWIPLSQQDKRLNLMTIVSLLDESKGVILEVDKDQKTGRSLPRRHVCNNRNIKYFPSIFFRDGYYDYGTTLSEWQQKFHHYAYGRKNGKFWMPSDNEQWFSYDLSSVIRYEGQANSDSANNINIITGHDTINFTERFNPPKRVIEEDDECPDFSSCGAARFFVRRENGLPTYYDQCEALYIIYQNAETETIEPLVLLEANEKCPGGERIIGTINTSTCFIESQGSAVQFILAQGEAKANSPLKMLFHDFGVETKKRQPLVLKPSMIPGQGIATVEVEGKPLLEENVFLDFLKMEKYDKTIADLQKELKRSFPLDMPGVKADYEKWRTCSQSVRCYLTTGILPKPDSFAKGYRPNPNANGLERYERCNVFGNVEGFIYPEKNAEFFEDLFDLLANKYRICSEEDEDYETIIRLIAWTYQSNNEKFAPIIKEIVEKMYRRAIAGGILKQEHTLCSNLIVSDDDISLYIKAWLKRTNYDISNNKIQVSDWLRSFAGILIYQNNALKNQSSKTCAEVVRNLVEILSYYHKENKEIGIDWALRCFLFILKRRKYDKMFLRQQGDDSKLYNNAVSTLEKIKRSFSNYEFLRSCCLKFLTGNGTLDDFLKGFPKND